MISVFQRPLTPGWVYPCSAEDLRRALARFPPGELEGLWAVGLVPEPTPSRHAYGTYHWENRHEHKPVIHLPAWREGLSFRHYRYTSRGEVYAFCAVERAYGMEVMQGGGRWLCRWPPEALRAYVLHHVLAHEVGHHVCHRQRRSQGLSPCPGTGPCEQFAEDYALRLNREREQAPPPHARERRCHAWPRKVRRPHRPQQGRRPPPVL